MTTINTIKREVEILQKALAPNDKTDEAMNNKTQQTLFFYDRLLELTSCELQDTDALDKLTREIEAFTAQTPLSVAELKEVEPYLAAIDHAARLDFKAHKAQRNI